MTIDLSHFDPTERANVEGLANRLEALSIKHASQVPADLVGVVKAVRASGAWQHELVDDGALLSIIDTVRKANPALFKAPAPQNFDDYLREHCQRNEIDPGALRSTQRLDLLRHFQAEHPTGLPTSSAPAKPVSAPSVSQRDAAFRRWLGKLEPSFDTMLPSRRLGLLNEFKTKYQDLPSQQKATPPKAEPTFSQAQEITRLERQLAAMNPLRTSPRMRASIEARLEHIQHQIARSAF